jgi:hypothetical protein
MRARCRILNVLRSATLQAAVSCIVAKSCDHERPIAADVNAMPTAPHRLERFREPGMLFGGGLLAGLLLFAIWYAMQPSAKSAPPAAAAGVPADTSKPGRTGESVLGGDLGAAPARPALDLEQAQADAGLETEPDPANEADDAEAVAQDDAAAPELSDEEAIAGGLLSDDGNAAPLRTWYVEVMRGPGVSEMLEIEAATPEQALSVLRDFRGDPRVLRGPSKEPLP